MKHLLTLLLLLPLCSFGQVVTYPTIPSHQSTLYSCTVNGSNSPMLITTSVDGSESGHSLSYTIFSFSGTVNIAITKIGSSATSAIVMPGGSSVSTTLSGGNSTINITTTAKGKYGVYFSDDASRNNRVVVFANPLETDIPDTTLSTCRVVRDSSILYSAIGSVTTLYFPPGTVKFGRYTIPSTVTEIYQAGGSFIQGYFLRTAGGNINIHGRGVHSNFGYPYHYGGSSFSTWYRSFSTTIPSVTTTITGITYTDQTGPVIYFGNGGNKTVTWCNFPTWRFNNDNITTNGNGNGVVNHNYYSGIEDANVISTQSNYTASNNVFDQLNSACYQGGFQAHTLSNISISNDDIWYMKPVLSTNNGGYWCSYLSTPNILPTSVSNVTISNINFETAVQYFLRIGVATPTGAPYVYSNWNVNHITLLGSGTQMSVRGFSACFPSFYPGDISFSNFTLNGGAAPLTDPTFFAKSNYAIAPNCGVGSFSVRIRLGEVGE